MSLPPVRRIVTGHSPSGDAIIESDKELTPYNPLPPSLQSEHTELFNFSTIYRTDAFPARNDTPWVDLHGQAIPLSHPVGTTARIVDFPPGPGFMHRTQSLDFAVVLAGIVELELDNGVTTTVRQGDVVVQRGTIHSWINKGTEIARIMFVLVPADPVKVDNGEVLGPTPLPPALGGESQ